MSGSHELQVFVAALLNQLDKVAGRRNNLL